MDDQYGDLTDYACHRGLVLDECQREKLVVDKKKKKKPAVLGIDNKSIFSFEKEYIFRALKSHALSVSLTHFDVISRTHAHTSISHVLALF